MNGATRTAAVVLTSGAGCALCRASGLCPQCEGYGDLPAPGGRSGEPCPLCAGDTRCPQCTGTRVPAAVAS